MLRCLTKLLLVFVLILPAIEARAVNPDEVLDDPALELRARELSAQLRCLVCQNQSIDDSDAQLARDLRLLVREKLLDGMTNQQILDHLVERYGEFVLLNPRVSSRTLLLWLAPLILLVVGCAIAWFMFSRQRRSKSKPSDLSAAEKAQIDELLSE